MIDSRAWLNYRVESSFSTDRRPSGWPRKPTRDPGAARVTFIENDRYAQTNSLVSLWLARKWVNGPFVLINVDVLAHPAVYYRVLATKTNSLAYDSASSGDAEHMKVAVDNGRVQAIDKNLPEAMTSGENVGILHFDREGTDILFEQADSLIAQGMDRGWAPAAVDRLARMVPVQAVDITGLPWTEIDFPEDLTRAQCSVWPGIAGAWSVSSAGESDAADLKRVS